MSKITSLAFSPSSIFPYKQCSAFWISHFSQHCVCGIYVTQKAMFQKNYKSWSEEFFTSCSPFSISYNKYYTWKLASNTILMCTDVQWKIFMYQKIAFFLS